MNCKNCTYWTQESKVEGVINNGRCSRLIQSDQLQITIRTGHDGGYVDSIFTEEDFGCTEFKIRETLRPKWLTPEIIMETQRLDTAHSRLSSVQYLLSEARKNNEQHNPREVKKLWDLFCKRNDNFDIDNDTRLV